jgi:hypothetical protein
MGSGQVTFQAISGSLSHNAQLQVSVVPPVTGAHAPVRARYLRTNLYYSPNSFQLAPPRFTIYDAAHKRFFVSNAFLNEIDVFDATQQIEIAQIPVPSAWGLDISPLNGSLYVGTLIGDIYQVDPGSFAVLKRYPAASIGPNGFAAATALVLSDGRLALQGGAGGIIGVDGFGFATVWDPATNAMDTGVNGTVCNVGNQGAFALSGDRTRILVTTIDEGGGGQPICSYDDIAKKATYGSFPFPTFVREIVPSPDGSRFYLTSNLNGVGVFDAKSLQLLGQITGTFSNSGLPNAPSGAVLSPDGKTLYLTDQASGAIGAFDTTSFRLTGWVPSFTIMDSQETLAVAAMDETGLIAGPIGHGVGFVDSTQLTSGPPTLIGGIFANPATGPVSGGTTLTGFASAEVKDSATLNQIYVGNVPGLAGTFQGNPGQSSSGQVTTPPSNQGGAVDLTVVLSDGGVGIVPETFSYGPTILEVLTNGATAEGGQTGTLVGYGFGNSTSGVQVTVGGQSAPVTGIFDEAPIEPFPFPTNELQFTIPPGVAGTTVDVTVTTHSGPATASKAFRYVAAAQSYPLTANLQSGVYDPSRDLYYFADQAQIQVLDRKMGKWLTPFSLPGTTSKSQLLAISLSPDASKLAISDYGGQAIYVLDPGNPPSATMYPMTLDPSDALNSYAPSGLAVTNGGIVYFTTADVNGTGSPLFHKLDTTKSTIVDVGFSDGLSSGGGDAYDRVLLSSDGTHVYALDGPLGFMTDTSNDQVVFSPFLGSGASQDLAISGDGNTIDVGGQFADTLLNPRVDVAYIDWETWFPTGALGQKLNQDGSILFQPLEDGIDLLSGSTGRLEFRVQIPDTTAGVYDSLVVADSPNSLMVITANGVTFLDLSSLPLSLARASSGASIERIGNHSSHPAAGTSLVNPQRQRYNVEQPTLRRRAKGARFSGH